MTGGSRTAFLALVAVQALHSIEEYATRLYDRFAPARFVTGLISDDRRVGFILFNVALVGFGLWCWLGPVRRGARSAAVLAWFWVALESANGIIHIAWAAAAGAYRPGVATAPLLLVSAFVLVRQLTRAPSADGSAA
jgi:Protein of unknown function with HXXEE motif